MLRPIQILEARVRASMENFGVGFTGMMGEMVNYKPRCCGCTRTAVGRICYDNGKQDVVDNPFCHDCFQEVYKQTRKLIKALNPNVNSVSSEWVLVQKWYVYNPIPPLPKTVSDLIMKGARISEQTPELLSFS